MESPEIPKPCNEIFLVIDLLYQLNIILLETKQMELVFILAKAKAWKT